MPMHSATFSRYYRPNFGGMYSFKGSSTFKWLSNRSEDHGTTIAVRRQEEMAEVSDVESNKWKPRRLILHDDNSDDEDDDDSGGGEDFLPDRSVNSGGEQEHILNPLCFSPLKFNPRKGVLCNSDSDDEGEFEDVTNSTQEQDQQPPPESIEKAVQRNNEDSPPSPWGNKCKAKQKIWKELDDPQSSIHLMTPEQIHQKWASGYPWKRFKVNFEAMKTQKRVYTQCDDVEPWKTRSSTSTAHDLLFSLFMDRETTKVHTMTADEVWASHECFKRYDIKEFRTYVRAMEKRTKELLVLVAEEEAAYRAFRRKYPRNDLTNKGVPFWDDHPAKALLEKDVKDGTAAQLKPKKLWSTRPEYKSYTLKIFTEHYYQEMRKQLAAPCWQYHRNIYAMKQHQEEVQNMKSEWDDNIIQDMFKGMTLDDDVSNKEATQEEYRKSLKRKNKTELQEILQASGLDQSGNKTELIERILKSDI